MQKKLELISRHDIDGHWFIIRLSVEGKPNKDLFRKDRYEAMEIFDKAKENLSILGDEIVLKSEIYPPVKNKKARQVFISSDTGECFEVLPEYHTGSFYDLKTDAPIEIVEKLFYESSITNDTPLISTIEKLKQLIFSASRF